MTRTPVAKVTKSQPATTGTTTTVGSIGSDIIGNLIPGGGVITSGGIPNPVTGIVTKAAGGVAQATINALRPYMKLAAGGGIMLAAGAALVFVAGARSKVGQVAGDVAGVVPGGGTAVKGATRTAAKPTPRRPDLAAARPRVARPTPARDETIDLRTPAGKARSRELFEDRRIKGPSNRPGGTRPKKATV